MTIPCRHRAVYVVVFGIIPTAVRCATTAGMLPWCFTKTNRISMVYIETSLKMVQQIDVSPTYKKNTTEKNTININHHPFTRDELFYICMARHRPAAPWPSGMPPQRRRNDPKMWRNHWWSLMDHIFVDFLNVYECLWCLWMSMNYMNVYECSIIF